MTMDYKPHKVQQNMSTVPMFPRLQSHKRSVEKGRVESITREFMNGGGHMKERRGKKGF